MTSQIRNYKVWTNNEEAKLVEALVNMTNGGGFKADNGFKSGYLQHLEQALKQSVPDSGILGKPHIESKIKTMKRDWQCVYDMLNGSNTSGFGYDTEKHCVTAEEPVWEAYLQVHKEATRWKHKSFPYYEDLCIVFGKDRAQGNRARDFVEIEQDVNVEEETQESDDDFIESEEVSRNTAVPNEESSPGDNKNPTTMSGRITADVEMKDSDNWSLPSLRHQNDELPYVHKVGKPPKQDLLKEIKTALKETFLSDDPLKPFKDQPSKRKLVLGFQTLFPILQWSRDYSFSKFKGDFIAGCTIASLCIPQDIGYAKLANLDPQYGLYSSFVPPLIYAFMGSSRDIAIGPVAVVSLLLGSMLQDELDPITQKHEYQRLAFTATFFAGVTQATLGFFRLGFLIDFLSHAAIVGFMGGAAVTIALQQLKGLFGIKKFTKKTDVVSVMRSVIQAAHHGWNWQTILIGVSFLVFLLVAKYIAKKNKKLFWVSAIAPLISVIISTVCVFLTRADRDGVQIVRHIDKGINPSSANLIYFSGDYLAKGFKIGVISGLIALTEAVAIGRTFASMKDYQIDGNKEMVALGTMNIVGSLTSCYVATGSFSRSAVNYMAGCNTAVSNIVMSCIVMLTLLVITPLFKYTPNAILASIIINAVVGLIDFDAVLLLWKIDKFDFLACMGAFFGVVFASVEIGLLIAVAISFAKILLQVTRPRTAVLGKIPRTSVYRNVEQYPGATRVPGVLIIRVDSAIYFSNSNYIKERILRWLTDEEEMFKDQPRVEYLIVDMSPVTDIDTSGIHALEELHSSLQKREVQLILTNPGQTVLDKLHASDFADMIGEDKIFLTVADAVLTFAPKMEQA